MPFDIHTTRSYKFAFSLQPSITCKYNNDESDANDNADDDDADDNALLLLLLLLIIQSKWNPK